jgi:hypothetical protein
MDDGYAMGDCEFLDRRKFPLFLEAAVELRLRSPVEEPSHDGELDPGRHATLGPLWNLVDDHHHVLVVAVVVCVHFCFCERLLEIYVKHFVSEFL